MSFSTTPASGSSTASTAVITPSERLDQTPSSRSGSSNDGRRKGKQRATSYDSWYPSGGSEEDEDVRYSGRKPEPVWTLAGDESDGSDYAPPGTYIPRPLLRRRALRPEARQASSSLASTPIPTSRSNSTGHDDTTLPLIPSSPRKRRKMTTESLESLYHYTPPPDTALPRRPGQRSLIVCVEIPYNKALAKRIADGEYAIWSERREEEAQQPSPVEAASSHGGEGGEETEVEAVVAMDTGGEDSEERSQGAEETQMDPEEGERAPHSEEEQLAWSDDELTPPPEVENSPIRIPNIIPPPLLSPASSHYRAASPLEAEPSSPTNAAEEDDSDYFEIIEAIPQIIPVKVPKAEVTEDDQESLEELVVAIEWKPPPRKEPDTHTEPLLPVALPTLDITLEISCHQCRRKLDGQKMSCSNRPKNRRCPFFFCEDCCKHYTYIKFLPSSRSFICPRCRDMCECAVCQRRRQILGSPGLQKPRIKAEAKAGSSTGVGTAGWDAIVLAKKEAEGRGIAIDIPKAPLMPSLHPRLLIRPSPDAHKAEKREPKGKSKAESSSKRQKRQSATKEPTRIYPIRSHPPIMLRLRRPKLLTPSPPHHGKVVDSDGDTVGGYSSEDGSEADGGASVAESSVTSRGNSRSPLPKFPRPFGGNRASSSSVTLSTNEYLSSLAPMGHVAAADEEDEEAYPPFTFDPSNPTDGPGVDGVAVAPVPTILVESPMPDETSHWPMYIETSPAPATAPLPPADVLAAPAPADGGQHPAAEGVEACPPSDTTRTATPIPAPAVSSSGSQPKVRFDDIPSVIPRSPLLAGPALSQTLLTSVNGDDSPALVDLPVITDETEELPRPLPPQSSARPKKRTPARVPSGAKSGTLPRATPVAGEIPAIPPALPRDPLPATARLSFAARAAESAPKAGPTPALPNPVGRRVSSGMAWPPFPRTVLPEPRLPELAPPGLLTLPKQSNPCIPSSSTIPPPPPSAAVARLPTTTASPTRSLSLSAISTSASSTSVSRYSSLVASYSPYTHITPYPYSTPVPPPALQLRPSIIGNMPLIPTQRLAVSAPSGRPTTYIPITTRTPLAPAPLYNHFTPTPFISSGMAYHPHTHHYPNQRHHSGSITTTPAPPTAEAKTAVALEIALAQMRTFGWNNGTSSYFR